MRIIFFGTSFFAAKILDFLIRNQVEVAAVITKPDKPQGRSDHPVSSPVKKYVLKNNSHLPLYQPEKASAPSFAERLKPYKADLFIVVAYGEIIKENLLNMPRLSCLNVHASLLPKYRGAAPIQFALLNGDKESGITVMEMVSALDAGAIIKQIAVPIPDHMNLEELEAKLCEVGSEGLLEVIDDFKKGSIQKTVQNHNEATYVKKIDSSMAQINWKESAQTLHNRIRAFSPKPGAWCMISLGDQIKRLKILRSRVIKGLCGICGSLAQYDKSHWKIFCGEDALELIELQLEGKRRMLTKDFLLGHPFPPLMQNR